MLRHFAFFDASLESMTDRDGREFSGCRWIRDVKVDVDPPEGAADAAWLDDVSGRQGGEICLDVTPFDYEEGDFCWMVFRPHDATTPGTSGLLDWPVDHTFIEIDPDMRLSAYANSARPIRPNAEHPIIIDITYTPLEAHYRRYGPIFGRFVVDADGVLDFQSDTDLSWLPMPATATLKVLAAVPHGFPTTQTPALVPVERMR